MAFGTREITLHPFGKGNLTAAGSQYSTEVTNTTTTYTAVQTATIDLPGLDKILEIEFGITTAIKTATAQTTLLKVQASDDAVTWVDLCSAASTTGKTTYVDVTRSGRFDVTTAGFLGKGQGKKSPFYLRMVSAKSSTASATLTSKAKNSSYLHVVYTGF